MKHAYLIMAYNNWNQLKKLISLLDHVNNDIYISIDKKSKSNMPFDDLKNSTQYSHIYIYCEIKVYWGCYSQIESELLLLEKSINNATKYDYYHLLSGMDLPIKSQEYIQNFFEKHRGKNFVAYLPFDKVVNNLEIKRRVEYRHYFHSFRRRYKFTCLNSFFVLLERTLLVLQIVFGIKYNNLENINLAKGSNWFSITDDLARYVLSKKDEIYKIYKWSNSGDELFLQTLIYNSKFKYTLYDQNFDGNPMANLRFIDWSANKESPYVFTEKDFKRLINNDYLFARKFDERKDKKIIEEISKYVSNQA